MLQDIALFPAGGMPLSENPHVPGRGDGSSPLPGLRPVALDVEYASAVLRTRMGPPIASPLELPLAHRTNSGNNISPPRHDYKRKMRFVPLSQVTMMSPPLGVIGRPVAVSMYAISGLVPSTPVSL